MLTPYTPNYEPTNTSRKLIKDKSDIGLLVGFYTMIIGSVIGIVMRLLELPNSVAWIPAGIGGIIFFTFFVIKIFSKKV
jgi:hypothetical protein